MPFLPSSLIFSHFYILRSLRIPFDCFVKPIVNPQKVSNFFFALFTPTNSSVTTDTLSSKLKFPAHDEPIPSVKLLLIFWAWIPPQLAALFLKSCSICSQNTLFEKEHTQLSLKVHSNYQNCKNRDHEGSRTLFQILLIINFIMWTSCEL